MLPSMSKKQRKSEQLNRQLRIIEVKLFPPTAKHYPRFDYEEMCMELGLEVTEEKKTAESNAFHDQDAEEIVRRLEAKYGTGTAVVSLPSTSKKSGKKSKKSLKFAPEDVMDKGLGYDLEDDFIDDEQAYDEWVPTTMDTAKRGHYVNKGPLEFRQIDLDETNSEKEDEEKEEEEESNGTGGETSILEADEEEIQNVEENHRNETARGNGDEEVMFLEGNVEIEVLPTSH